MSAQGLNPKVNWLNLVPLSADPSNPQEGDVFYSDGTPRTEGPWVYQNGSWAQFSTGAAITVVNNLTLTPQAADPGSPAAGMLFYSDGTSRAAGLWAYNGTGWVQLTGVRYQEFTHKQRFTVRAASTANVTLANQVENGDSFGGVTLATNDLVLLKNQTTASENGVYVVQVSGAPIRSTSFDSAAELNGAQILVSSGTNAGNTYWQTATLTSLLDPQTWGLTPPTQTFTVPEGVYELNAETVSGGGGGGNGGAGSDGANQSGAGGGGGGGSQPFFSRLKVNPGDAISVDIGVGGAASNSGTSTVLTIASVAVLTHPGANGGFSGTAAASPNPGGAGGSAYAISNFVSLLSPAAGGAGGTWSGFGSAGNASPSRTFIVPSTSAAGGAAGIANFTGGTGGGGGGSGKGIGGAGGAGGSSGGAGTAGSDAPLANYGAGGGGGGGGSESGSRPGGAGGRGADGYVRISW